MEQPEVIIEGLDVIDVVRYISRKKDKFIAIVLADLEEVMEKDSNEYKFIRKVFLDGFNDYTRSVMRTLFGNVEGLTMK
ncbi:hypothetical protein KA005_43760 [bacterium]|nr:hypothetical protein [bacterium]